MVTFRPLGIDETEPVERCRLFERLRNKAGQFARDHGFPFTAVWSRETQPGVVGPATGEHLHLLIHIPRKWLATFEAAVINWLPGPTSVDVRWRGYKKKPVWLGNQGVRFHSAVGYLVKQMDSQAAYKNEFTYVKGGPVLGKRAGVTKNLTAKAIAAWWDDCSLRRPLAA